jgi:hypothetical protein
MVFRLLSTVAVFLSLLPLLSCGANVCFAGSAPQITSVTPGTVPSGSSSVQVTVFGSNFSDGTALVFNDGTQLSPVTVTSSRMTFSFAATFFNGVGTIQFHLQDGCRGASNTVLINVVSNP